MDCKRPWSADFLAANFPLSFRNDTLRKWRRRVLLEREKSMLPAMQQYVEAKKELTNASEQVVALRKRLYLSESQGGENLSAKLHEAKEKVWTIQGKVAQQRSYYKGLVADLGKDHSVTIAEQLKLRDLAALRNAAEEERDAQQEHFSALAATLRTWDLAADRARRRYAGEAVAEAEGEGGAAVARREFIMKCPDEGCRGFLSSVYKCGTCDKWTCSKCLVVIGTEKDGAHTCDPGTVESAKMIRAETRPCPKCGTRIFKVEGCDQMFCTMPNCNTAFSWNTGQVVAGRIHNPHYYEWLRRGGGGEAPREAGDIPCGGMPHAWQLARCVQRRLGVTPVIFPIDVGDSYTIIYESHRNLEEMITERLPKMPATMPQLFHRDLDVAYLMNTITEAEWQRDMELNEAKFNRKKEIGQILQMVATAGSELFRVLMARADAIPAWASGPPQLGPVNEFRNWFREVFVRQLEDLRTYANQSLRDLATRQHQAVPQFGPNWKWVPMRALYKAAGRGGGAAATAAEDSDPLEELPDEPDAATATATANLIVGPVV